MGLVYVATLCAKPDVRNQQRCGITFDDLNMYGKSFMMLSLMLKGIRVEVGWLIGFQHTLVALKFGPSDVLDFVVI